MASCAVFGGVSIEVASSFTGNLDFGLLVNISGVVMTSNVSRLTEIRGDSLENVEGLIISNCLNLTNVALHDLTFMFNPNLPPWGSEQGSSRGEPKAEILQFE
ncbi:hypothetical protein K432DRAFT_396500 [Lepidopterella palustris CBS 459.81]|uniref:Uncharacterized protein n=1 Tax=Lepidopterella palustris CBS 459.81 TaxID=1314670 RepID=A0A8E2E2X2_9PEZI|nr:hypothetical protein K432DRAFT_396500 [Lepidopterella palustris CBS 459.81]